MYLLSEMILLSPLIFYAGYRIRSLIAGKIAKNVSSGLVALLVLGYPIAESLSHNSGRDWARYPMIAGYCCLPFLLYLILITPASDFLAGIARWSKAASRSTVESVPFRAARLSCLLLLPAAIVVLGAWNNNRLQVKQYILDVPRRSSKLDQLKIAFASDFHLGSVTSGRFMERFVDKVNSLDPDIVLIGGDVIEGDRQDQNVEAYEAQFRRLRSKYGTYAVPGNHERMRGGVRGEFFARSGITLLQDKIVSPDQAFYLAGRNDGRAQNRKPVDELLRDAPDNLPLILLDHRPIDLEAASRCHVDIQLSGHTHNGQLWPVNYIHRFTYELSWGYLKKRQTHFIVTSGVQVWGPPVRTAGDSEIVLIQAMFR